MLRGLNPYTLKALSWRLIVIFAAAAMILIALSLLFLRPKPALSGHFIMQCFDEDHVVRWQDIECGGPYYECRPQAGCLSPLFTWPKHGPHRMSEIK